MCALGGVWDSTLVKDAQGRASEMCWSISRASGQPGGVWGYKLALILRDNQGYFRGDDSHEFNSIWVVFIINKRNSN